MTPFKVYCQYEAYAMKVSFYIFKEEDGKKLICQNMNTMKFKIARSGQLIKPTFVIDGPFITPLLTAFANMLEEQGIRAEGKPVLENELSAVRYHLNDMRTLAFDQLNVSKPSTEGDST